MNQTEHGEDAVSSGDDGSIIPWVWNDLLLYRSMSCLFFLKAFRNRRTSDYGLIAYFVSCT